MLGPLDSGCIYALARFRLDWVKLQGAMLGHKVRALGWAVPTGAMVILVPTPSLACIWDDSGDLHAGDHFNLID